MPNSFSKELEDILSLAKAIKTHTDSSEWCKLEYLTTLEQDVDAIIALIQKEVIGEDPFNFMSGGVENAQQINSDLVRSLLRAEQRSKLTGKDK